MQVFLYFIVLFKNEPGSDFVKDLLVKMANDEIEGYITMINIGEIYYMISHKNIQKWQTRPWNR